MSAETTASYTSAQNREGKTWQFSAGLLGTLGPGLEVGYFLDPNTVVAVHGSRSENAYTEIGDDDDRDASRYEGAEGRIDTYGASYKRFFGNSFYGKAGLAYQSLKVWGEFADGPTTAVGETRRLVTELTVGNQWQWRNFTLGCDWFGVLPQLYPFYDRFETPQGTDRHSRDEARDHYKVMQLAGQVQVLKFYVGVAI